MYRCHHIFLILLLFSGGILGEVFRGDQNCSCGFYDPDTEELFTDAIIVYFNETDRIPDDFVTEKYENTYEKDWNAIYRQGALPSNVQLNGSSKTLDLFVSPPTDEHLVNGAGLLTRRKDIQHGSFRVSMKGASRSSRGTAMSMMWQFNETEVTELSVMNMNDPMEAWVGTFVNNEFTTRDLGTNFSTALATSHASSNYSTLGTSLTNGSMDLWYFTEYRIDWTKDMINFFIQGNMSRSVERAKNRGMPSVPAPFHFKHWSTGNRFSMRGPPRKPAIAKIEWIRMFFNSSTTTTQAREDFNAQCSLVNACSMGDHTLRGSTPSSRESAERWKQEGSKSIIRKPALWISVICLCFSSFLVIHALILRAPWRRRSKPDAEDKTSQSGPKPADQSDSNPFEAPAYIIEARTSTSPSPTITSGSMLSGGQSQDDLAIEKVEASPEASLWGGSTHGGPSRPASTRFDSRGTTPKVLSPCPSTINIAREEMPLPNRSLHRLERLSVATSKRGSERTLVPSNTKEPQDKVQMSTVTESALPAPRMKPQPLPPRQRIDYLAGLVAMCAILVTVMHFGLTFVPAIVIPGAPRHHESEYWAQRIVAPFILNQMWLGVFFTTSVRFLVSPYLKRGNLQDIAKAAVRRTPRLMIPVASIAMLEYFLVDCGATKFLRYIPSLTWSTWPYVTRYPTAGHFVSEVLELIYLVPNGVPQITFNFCTGVLWTIAVQLQGTWLILCGVIVVYEIRSPWKRMAYYAFCVLNHWYAQSWGSYLWLGLLLTDLDISFKYREYLHASPCVYYPLITLLWLCVATGFSANVIPNWIDFNFATYEHNIHPDIPSGEALWNTPNAGYPAYYKPRLNGLLFAAGMQAIVEISPSVQWVLSMRAFLVLFPHIFTIYLLHGLVFWSWGSWLMIFLADRGLSYGTNVAVVGVTSYALLFASLPLVTPVIEALGKDITSLVWMSAVEESPPRRRTLFPFPDDLLASRQGGGKGEGDVEKNGGVAVRNSAGSGSVVVSSGSATPSSEKAKAKDEIKEISQFDFQFKGKGKVQQVRSVWDE
ncbi:glycoside hydrolase family 16 protein [Aaosphaeria arxii CBS 175.79]|uniref:Glycoside hydrolase family 16 protein n=1 Tax=Aaosphaeria arxii CBS 175.79 TaxID=1450172 RepID=A0A6A5XSC4_9PLEO|nr:glycoside hydrolase family 16 protein [Aaosphaeria arxii CBS 175.79]KAF2015707.1 glycoside hydrolase family 16 protein [Aaosphaeria arxii CBS 175.79]